MKVDVEHLDVDGSVKHWTTAEASAVSEKAGSQTLEIIHAKGVQKFRLVKEVDWTATK